MSIRLLRGRRIMAPLALVASLLTAPGARAQQVELRGSVKDSVGGPIAYANAQVNDGVRVVSDDSGRFVLRVDRSRPFTLEIRRIGWRPFRERVEIRGDTTLAITLEPIAQRLQEARIAAGGARRSLDVNGFYRRMADREKGILNGHFITEEEVDRRKPHRITQMLEGLPSVRVMRYNTSNATQRAGIDPMVERTSCLSGHDPVCNVPVGVGNCPMTVYVDGRRINALNRVHPDRAYAFNVDGYALPTAVAGIEVYTSATRLPPEYQPLNGRCGAILIWTK